jgi:hypothetical protein
MFYNVGTQEVLARPQDQLLRRSEAENRAERKHGDDLKDEAYR